MTEILTIPELKILISQEEETIRVKRQSLKYHEDLLIDLRKRLDESIVDGLRMRVREFIANAEAPESFSYSRERGNPPRVSPALFRRKSK